MLTIEGHAIVSADGMIADAAGEYPNALRNDADWRLYQAALDRSAVVVVGRQGHERHPNPGRRRLVLTRRVERLGEDPNDPRATFWNPGGLDLRSALAEIGIGEGLVAITGLFDLFLADYDGFVLSESHRLLIPGGTPCFAGGHPRIVLAEAGLQPASVELIDAAAMVTTTVWARR
ncbi:MAG: dihydrofolate reductase [Hyphomicrobiales bacterium]|nr:MAG: dihydrofolate reductase [Hyphomicrobiales bacterium]